jgi:hypothetical protein
VLVPIFDSPAPGKGMAAVNATATAARATEQAFNVDMFRFLLNEGH